MRDPRPKTSIVPAIVVGASAILIGVGGFLAWALSFEISSGSTALGEVAVESRRQSIEAVEGGAVAEILVRDGDRVEKNALLVRLDSRVAQSDIKRLQGREDAARVRLARLRAELRGEHNFVLPPQVAQRAPAQEHGMLRDVIATQRAEFDARKRDMARRVDAARNRIAQLDQQIAGDSALATALQEQSVIAQRSLASARELYAKKLSVRARVDDAEREVARIRGELASRRAAIARAQDEKIAQQHDLDAERAKRSAEIASLIDAAHDELMDVEERLHQAHVVLEHTEIRAPVAGVVVARAIHTIGAEVRGGDQLMEIVPAGDRLMVQARVSPVDVDHVQIGMQARVRFSAFSQRTTPVVEGAVATVAADVQTDPATGEKYYSAVVDVPDEQIAQLGELDLIPGMPAEVMFLTGERTPWRYLTEPIADALNNSMRDG